MAQERAISSGQSELRLAFADETAFRAWYDRAMPRVFAYLVSRTGDRDKAEELTQQTFVAAVSQRRGFDGHSDSVTWLIGIARHKLADQFRERDRIERRQLRLEVREVAVQESAVAWESADERDAILTALGRLPPAQQAALLFADLDDLPVREIARLIGRREGATQSLITRARESFRKAYREDQIDG